MALTSEEEDKIRQLLARESEQKQKSVLASKNSFKSWLKQVAGWLVAKLTDHAIDLLFQWLLGC
ncbi:hypothetical protein [Planktothrix mougeotii]|uniref:Uncharacterized protein n=1 Tax=Planktothrix mougeotii LEGE 06226 TaxID=1828728 RepID=A0ABR9UCF7_9CYAN|nr:hypothetical protein [Planktothrix mougeotii]MBE9144153.1 hypothetical protein [Planktothrix mougeotii LEGE 06226]